MATFVDSTAHFESRCKDVDLTGRCITALRAANINTFGKIAFAFGHPGQDLQETDFQTWAKNTIADDISISELASLKRVFFEAHAAVLHQMKESLESPGDNTTPRKVPTAERESRMNRLKARLIGLDITGPNEPAHALLGMAADMKDKRQLKYLGPEQCVSRHHEVTNHKSSKQVDVSFDKLVVREKASIPNMPLGGELQVYEALVRRGLAFAFAEFVTFTKYSKYMSTLFAHLSRDAPPNFQKCQLSQIIAADRLVFSRIIEDGFSFDRTVAGDHELDDKLMQVLTTYEVSFALMPRPAKDPKQRPSPYGDPPRGVKEGPKGKGKGKKKGGDKSKGSSGPIPKELVDSGCVGMDSQGRRLCFNYNLRGCKDAAAGAQCKRGWHLCAKPDCHGPLPQHCKDHH